MEVAMRTAKALFQQYRFLVENEATIYADMREKYPGSDFPEHVRRVEFFGTLAEFWGRTATILGGGKVDYLADWAKGRK